MHMGCMSDLASILRIDHDICDCIQLDSSYGTLSILRIDHDICECTRLRR